MDGNNTVTEILAIDPGTSQSAYVLWKASGPLVLEADFLDNEGLRAKLRTMSVYSGMICALEWVTHYGSGMPAGKEVFETVRWIGRFEECWIRRTDASPLFVSRPDIKLHHCRSSRAKDANVRQALIDKYGAPGVKKTPGITYGLKSHLWSAFALATFVSETQLAREAA